MYLYKVKIFKFDKKLFELIKVKLLLFGKLNIGYDEYFNYFDI